MKNIVIVGAGDIGQYISLILSTEGYNIILIDNDAAKLERVGWEMDIATRVGSGTDWQLLDDLLELSPDFFIALTSNDEINLVACSIAKHLGFPRTIARVHDNRFLNRSRLDFFRIFDVDSFICPELLVAHDIVKYMMSPGSVTLEHFAHGAVQMRTLKVPKSWSLSGETLAKLKIPDQMIIGMIARGEGEQRKIIFPHGGDVILPEDEVTFVGENSSVSDVHEFLGIQEKAVKSVVIIGGSLTALNLAQILERW